MAISRFSTSSVAQGLPKYQKLWDGTSAVLPTTGYVAIATQTVGSGGAASITFNSIPSIYKHLQLRIVARTTYADTNSGAILNFNSDSGANYAWHRVYGDGGTGTAGGNASATFARIDRMPAASSTANTFGGFVVDILDYSDTNKTTAIKSIGGYDANGNGWSSFNSSLWMNTNTVSSITFANADGGNLVQYSQAVLYGIQG